MIPDTTPGVTQHTGKAVNERIRQDTLRRLATYENADSTMIDRRLDEEWNIQRVLIANAALVGVLGVGLGAT